VSGLLADLGEAVRDLELPDTRLLVAVSGGIDSTALLEALGELAPEFGLELVVGHVNHGLRGAEADADQSLVAAQAARLGLRFGARRVDPGRLRRGRPSARRPTLQEAARRVRYAALRELADELGAGPIATAHTADDQAETVLLRLLRGTGPAGLGGIPERSPDGRVVRPLLGVPRREVETFARERGLTWREDPSNRSPRFARSRLRERWLPELARDFNPQLLRALVDLAEAHRRENEWAEAEVAREAARRLEPDPEGLWIEAAGFALLPEALARRLVRGALHRAGAGRDVSRRHLLRALAFLRRGRPGARLELPGGLELRCAGTRYRLLRPGARLPC
jgi:tRNA(Ile)-lysidine synthase